MTVSNNWGQRTINFASQINHDLTPIVHLHLMISCHNVDIGGFHD